MLAVAMTRSLMENLVEEREEEDRLELEDWTDEEELDGWKEELEEEDPADEAVVITYPTPFI